MALDPEDTHRFKDLPHDPNPTAVARPVPAPRPPGAEAYLVPIHPPGPALGRRNVIGPAPVTIGRASTCTVCDPDGLVSRTHARIERRPDGRFQLTDLGSTNGTFVNHARVAAAVLGDGDYVRVGGSIYRFLAGGDVEAGYHEEIHRLAVTDPLTGLPNRRALAEFLDREVERARRYNRPVALALFDVDHFQAVNDRLGHVAGDSLLRVLAAAARPLVRRDELLARYGGDEFAAVLPETGGGPAARFGERVRRVVADHPLEVEGHRLAVTVSVGVGVVGGGEPAGADELIRRAEGQRDEAKRGGRNRVCPAG
jgi:diguanylate cyclase (GGDEF)-like protein